MLTSAIEFRGGPAYLTWVSVNFPTLLPLPAEVAASLRLQCAVAVRVNCTASDLAWVFVSLHAATSREKNSGGFWLLNDNDLRAVLGQTRRQRLDVEMARWGRLGGLVLEIGDRSYVGPTVGANAITPGGEAHWSIDDRLVDRWRTFEQTKRVYLPLQILQRSKHRTTILLALRILAWRAGFAPIGSVLAGDDNSLSLRLNEQQIRDEFSLGGDISKRKVWEHLDQACAELAEIDAPIVAQVSPVVSLRYTRPVTVRRRRAPIAAFDIYCDWDNEVLAPPKTNKFGGRGWRLKPRSTAREPRVLPLIDRARDNVVPFSGGDDVGFMDLNAMLLSKKR